MRSTQRSESMHTFYGGYLHTKTSLIQFVHEFDNVLGNKEQKELEDDAGDSKGVIQYVSSSMIEIQFQKDKIIKRKHTYIKSSHDVNRSDESMNILRGLRFHFYNVSQEFVSDIEEASILHSSLDDSLIKLYDYHASKLQSSVPSRQSSNASENQCAINVDLVLAPPQVSTKGRPSNKRLGAELDRSIMNATRRRKKDSTSVDFLVKL
ncbi:hypothetical protein PIB30_006893 [Stylosanthes scabra]|uniref:Protein FAR1-RELATED SEQUENCE n=1 Tax=Stylosanthes scabra TaxID=79078 RepID=A0ABU6W3U5_9FABA|nr:hypothetical protein [Stylosanthes scabra]